MKIDHKESKGLDNKVLNIDLERIQCSEHTCYCTSKFGYSVKESLASHGLLNFNFLHNRCDFTGSLGSTVASKMGMESNYLLNTIPILTRGENLLK